MFLLFSEVVPPINVKLLCEVLRVGLLFILKGNFILSVCGLQVPAKRAHFVQMLELGSVLLVFLNMVHERVALLHEFVSNLFKFINPLQLHLHLCLQLQLPSVHLIFIKIVLRKHFTCAFSNVPLSSP